MTYSVPYSFVPGTKAKADEVNANFMSVLKSLDDINSDVSEQNTANAGKFTEIESGIDGMKTDIQTAKSDIQTLQTTLNSKANAADIDGKWVKCSNSLLNGVTLKKGYTQTFSLSTLLKDSGVYEVIVNARVRTLGSSNTAYELKASTALCSPTYLCFALTRVNGNDAAEGSCVVPVGTDKKITLAIDTDMVNDSWQNGCFASITAYRKVR